MKKVFNFLLLLTAFSLIVSCGNRRRPTGGEVDKEKPQIVSVIPEQYSDIREKNIEITFSKPMDHSSIYEGERGIYFYPPISDIRFRWTDNSLTVEINQELEPDRNYYMTLSEQIRDLRGNNLEENYLLVFHTGQLINNRLYGEISYEKEDDLGLPVNFTLLSADTVRVFTKKLRGKNYSTENLDNEKYIMRTFIDKNRNNRYDIETDPYFETTFRAERNKKADIFLEYFDDTLPEIRSLSAEYQHLLNLTFNKPVKNIEEISMTTADTLMTEHEIYDYDILQDRLEIITAPMDSLEYTVTLVSVEDFKDNVASELSGEFMGSIEEDTASPEIIATVPRNGAVVDNLLPELLITFDKFMNTDSIELELLNTITGETIPLRAEAVNSRQLNIRPQKNLTNRTPYRLLIKETSKDMSGNSLEEDYTLQFLPISPELE